MKATGFLAVITILSALVFLSGEDFDAEMVQVEHYCAMVEAGNWPAYDKEIDCE